MAYVESHQTVVDGSSPYSPDYYYCFYPFDSYRTEECKYSAISPDMNSSQTNDCEFSHTNLNLRCNSDSDSYYTGSRPSSTHLSENELSNNYCHNNLCEDATYLLSLPNKNEWTLASSRNIHPSSPSSSSYADSRSSPMMSEVSFYDDVQTFQGGRKTPPPPYRPPVNNADFLCESASFKTISASKLMRPPPPYTETVDRSAIKCETFSQFSGLPVENSPLTADRIHSAVDSSGNGWMLPVQSDIKAGELTQQTAVGTQTSTEVLVPADPELWNKEHIHHWLTKVEHYYGISEIDRTHMPGDGTSLCRLSADDFRRITGDRRTADILSNYIDCIKQNIKFSSPSQENSGTEKNKTTFFEAIKKVIRKSPSNKSSSPSGGGQIQLWQFLLELLVDPKHSSLIAWEDEDGTFRLLDPEGTAKLWGERKFKETKSKKPMNYDKLSRSLRHYYMKGIVNKVSGRRYTYKFHLDGVLRACAPSGVSDSIFIYPNFDANNCDNSPRNFNLNLK